MHIDINVLIVHPHHTHPSYDCFSSLLYNYAYMGSLEFNVSSHRFERVMLKNVMREDYGKYKEYILCLLRRYWMCGYGAVVYGCSLYNGDALVYLFWLYHQRKIIYIVDPFSSFCVFCGLLL